MRSVFHTDSTSCVGYSNSRLEAAGKVGSLSLMTEETSIRVLKHSHYQINKEKRKIINFIYLLIQIKRMFCIAMHLTKCT